MYTTHSTLFFVLFISHTSFMSKISFMFSSGDNFVVVITPYIFALLQVILQLWLRFLEDATMVIKRKATSKQKGATNSKQRANKTGTTKQTYFASKCCGRNPGT